MRWQRAFDLHLENIEIKKIMSHGSFLEVATILMLSTNVTKRQNSPIKALPQSGMQRFCEKRCG